MTITEMMKEHYDEIIEAMNHAYEESLHAPYYIYCVDMDKETGQIVTHVFSDNNSWIEGYYRVWTCDNRTFDLFDCDSRSPEQIYKEDIEPLLNAEEKKKINEFIMNYQGDSYWLYFDVMKYIEDEFPYVWNNFKDNAVQDIIDCTENDYLSDILDERIRDNEQYEEMWSEC